MKAKLKKLIVLVLCGGLSFMACKAINSDHADQEVNMTTEEETSEEEKPEPLLLEKEMELPEREIPEDAYRNPCLLYEMKFPYGIWDVVYSEDGKTLYVSVSSRSAGIHVIDVQSGTTTAVYPNQISAEKLLLEGNKLYCISNTTVKVLDVVSGKELKSFTYLEKAVEEGCVITDAMLTENALFLREDEYTSYVMRVDLKDYSVSFCNLSEEKLVWEDDFETRFYDCFFDKKNQRIIVRSYDTYCYHVATGEVYRLPVAGSDVMLNPETGTVVVGYYDYDSDLLIFKLYDTDYCLFRDCSVDWSESSFAGLFFVISDISPDDSYLLLQDSFGQLLFADTYTNNDDKYYDHYNAKENPKARFVNQAQAFSSSGKDNTGGHLFNLFSSTEVYLDEVTDWSEIALDDQGFAVYNYKGELAWYSLETGK